MLRRRSYEHYLYSGLALLSLAAYGLLFYIWQLNAPYNDDLNDIVMFLLQYDSGSSWAERLHVLAEPHGGHRTTASRLVYLMAFELQGTADFVTLSLLANLALIAVLFIYSAVLFRTGSVAFAFALAALIVLTPRAYSIIHWAMAASHFYYLLLYALLTIVLLDNPGRTRLILALVTATAATCTSAGGQAVWLVGGLFLLYRRLVTHRADNLDLMLWLLTAILVTGAAYMSVSQESAFQPVEQAGVFHFLHYTFVLLGSALSFGSESLSLAAGLGLAAVFTLILLRDYPGKLHAGHFYCIMLLALAAAIGFGRSRIFPVDYALNARYSVVSSHFLACTLLLIFSRMQSLPRAAAPLTLLLAIVFSLGSYTYYGPRYEELMNRRIQAFNKGKLNIPFRDESETRAQLDEAIARGIYAPPRRPVEKHFVFTRQQDGQLK